MKKFLIFLAGFISGIVALIIVSLIINSCYSGRIQGLTIFEQPADIINTPSLEVFQVVQAGNALVKVWEPCDDYGGGIFSQIVLLIADENTHYYDDQIIKIPHGKCVRHIGIYQYETKRGYKTVPAVAICDQ